MSGCCRFLKLLSTVANSDSSLFAEELVVSGLVGA